MNCTSEIQKIPGLKPRRPIGLRRPTKVVPGLGTLERAREERCHSWQLSHSLVPTRLTLVDGILQDSHSGSEQISDAESFMKSLLAKERKLRERTIRARYFEFIDEGARSLPFAEILENLDDWMAPYRVDRWSTNDIFLKYDCSDAPDRALLGAGQIGVSLDADWSIHGVQYFTSGVADDLRIAAYRQRILPEGCGFVADCIADQFIGTSHVTPSPELAALLEQSIEQTGALLEQAGPGSRTFLRCAHELLCGVRTSRFSDPTK